MRGEANRCHLGKVVAAAHPMEVSFSFSECSFLPRTRVWSLIPITVSIQEW